MVTYVGVRSLDECSFGDVRGGYIHLEKCNYGGGCGR